MKRERLEYIEGMAADALTAVADGNGESDRTIQMLCSHINELVAEIRWLETIPATSTLRGDVLAQVYGDLLRIKKVLGV